MQKYSSATVRVDIKGLEAEVVAFGTGIVVEPGYLITCNHILSNSEEAERAEILFDYHNDISGRMVKPIS